jgi:cobalt-zinc-cadmium resistance protein CzcA
MIAGLQRIYEPLLQKAIRFKYLIVSLTVAIFALSAFFFFKNMGGEFIPQLQEGDYAFHCILPWKLAFAKY